MNVVRSFTVFLAAWVCLAAPVWADEEAIELRDMGSVHVGGRTVEIT